MIKVSVPSIIKENCLDLALELYRELVEETRKEAGCISYELFQDLNNPNHLCLFEKWEDEKALKGHSKTQHFISIVSKLAKYEEEGPVTIYRQVF